MAARVSQLDHFWTFCFSADRENPNAGASFMIFPIINQA